jgi:predicted aspartyl protease
MILEIVITLIAVVAIGLMVNFSENKIKRNSRKISFKESMDLAELPIVTFYQGDKKFNFLLDTGSNYSHISKEAAAELVGEVQASEGQVSGIGGEKADVFSGVCKTVLTYKNEQFDIELCIGEHLNDTFSAIKAETGVQVHGLIGNKFFQRYKYILDFEELVAYTKK